MTEEIQPHELKTHMTNEKSYRQPHEIIIQLFLNTRRRRFKAYFHFNRNSQDECDLRIQLSLKVVFCWLPSIRGNSSQVNVRKKSNIANRSNRIANVRMRFANVRIRISNKGSHAICELRIKWKWVVTLIIGLQCHES